MRDHEPVSVSVFRGTYGRDDEDTVSSEFFLSSQNIRFTKGGFASRYGSSLSTTISSVRRIVNYKPLNQASRKLILNNNGRIYDSTDLVNPILTIVGMTDFSAVTIFNRAFITPHNGITGMPGESIYIYDGSNPARLAAGEAPTTGTLAASNSATAGSVERGDHAFGFAYLTASGFITAPAGFVLLSATGAFKVSLSNIGVGPTGTVGRVLVATRRLIDFNGDFENQTYYFVPDGVINDNATTTLTVNFYDADLQSDATYLFEQLSTIPAGVGIAAIAGRLITWGEDANSSIIRVSATGQPESHGSVDGFIIVNPGDAGGGVKNLGEYRKQIIINKSLRSYVVGIDNVNPPSLWDPTEIDASVGTECHGIGKSLDSGANVEDRMFIADRGGLRLFSGTFGVQQIGDGVPDILSYNIKTLWDRINPLYFHKIEVAVDPTKFLVYIAVPLDSATSPNAVLVGDYAEGLTSQMIRWTTWTFPNNIHTILVDTDNATQRSILYLGSLDGNIYIIDPLVLTDYGSAIAPMAEFPFLPTETDTINHFTGVKVRVSGSGDLLISGRALDDSQTFGSAPITLDAAPGLSYFKGFNLTTERCAVKLRLGGIGEYFNISKFTLYQTPVWEDRASTGAAIDSDWIQDDL